MPTSLSRWMGSKRKGYKPRGQAIRLFEEEAVLGVSKMTMAVSRVGFQGQVGSALAIPSWTVEGYVAVHMSHESKPLKVSFTLLAVG